MKEAELINKNQLLSWRWAPMSAMVRRSPVLSDGAKILYNEIVSFIWQKGDVKAWPGQDLLAENLSVTPRTVRMRIRELRRVKLIEVKRRGMQKTNEYYLVEPDVDLLGVVPDGKGSWKPVVKK